MRLFPTTLVLPLLFACGAARYESRGEAMYDSGLADAAPAARSDSIRGRSYRSRPTTTVARAAEPEESDEAPPPPPEPEPTKGSPSDTEPVPTNRRLVIYTADFTVLVGSVADASAAFLRDVASDGGYLQSQHDTTITVRIPADKFEALTKKIGDYGQIIQKNIQAEDVTRAVTELQIRIENAERARARILELLQKAQRMEEIIELERELTRITEQIELMKGQMRSFEDRIAFSTVTVTFRSNAPEVRPQYSSTYSPFEWINEVGAEHVLNRF